MKSQSLEKEEKGMKELTGKIQSLTLVIGLLVLLMSVIEWFTFLEMLANQQDVCDAFGVEECKYAISLRLLIILSIQTIIGVALISFNLGELDSSTSQHETASDAYETASDAFRPMVADKAAVETVDSTSRCKYWIGQKRCRNMHTNKNFCDEHLEEGNSWLGQ